MKGSAGSLVALVSWLGSWIVSFAFNFLMDWSSAGNAALTFLSYMYGVIKKHSFISPIFSHLVQEHFCYSVAYVA